MRKILFSTFAAALSVASAQGAVVLENARLKLIVGDNAVVQSLQVKPSGEECIDPTERLPLFSVTQDRPYNNEIKLTYPNTQTTYPANSVRQVGDELIVGFEIAPYEARVKVRVAKDYLLFELAGFIVEREDYGNLKMTLPPVKSFRLMQLPVRNRTNFGDWLNVVWDEKAATAVVGGGPLTVINGEKRHGFRLLVADADRDLKLVGATAAIVAAETPAFLESLSSMEKGCGLPLGVESRKCPEMNASIYWSAYVTPNHLAGVSSTSQVALPALIRSLTSVGI